MRRLLVALLAAAAFAPAPGASAGRVTIQDGFTVTGPAGGQVVVRLARDLAPPGLVGQGPAVTLTASGGDLAGFALVGATRYSTVVRALPRFVCGAAECGEGVDLDIDTNVRSGGRLPKGEYLLVLLGSPGTRVSVTVPTASPAARPVRVPVAATAPVEVARTTDVGGTVPGGEQEAQGSWTRVQSHHRVLAGVVHVASLQYGHAVSYSLSCPGHARSGSVALKNDRPGPVPVGWAYTPMYTTHAAFGESRAVEATLTPAWSGRVEAARAEQHGLAVYVPLVAR